MSETDELTDTLPVREGLNPEAKASDGDSVPQTCETALESSALPLLEELIEPLESNSLPQPLAAEAVVAASEGEKYRIIGFLRTENSTHLYEVTSEDSGETCWLHQALDDSAATRLLHEAEVLQGLASPMFPRVLACFESDGDTFVAIEPTKVESPLADLIIAGGETFSQLLSALVQVAYGLSRLHEHGWAHLGLRPGVIFPGKPVKITDLSYATRLGDKPATRFYHAGYSPPELLTEEPVDARADIYALGALLFHAVNGQAIPETGAELGGWTPPTPLAGVPQILHRCLGGKETRYTTMTELHHDLLRLKARFTPRVTYSLASTTTIGLEPTRTTNQDAYACLTGKLESEEGPEEWAVACVCDGMGGMAAGEVASDAAVKSIMSQAATSFAAGCSVSAEDQATWVKQWVHVANAMVCDVLAGRNAKGGCTLLCACIVGQRMTIAHVGDCRLYLLHGEEITQLTRDHSVVMALAMQGEISMDEIRHHPDRNKVTRSLGDRQPMPDYFVDGLEVGIDGNQPGAGTGGLASTCTRDLQPGDVLLLCTDGLWEPVVEEEMKKAIHGHAPDLNAAAHAMLDHALQRGAPDNATVVLLRLDET